MNEIERKELELLDCPFCGCKATFVNHSAGVAGTRAFDKWDAVACKHCRATVGACDRRFRSREDAASAWNRRIQHAALATQQPRGEVVVTTDKAGNILFVSRQVFDKDDPYKSEIVEVLAQAPTQQPQGVPEGRVLVPKVPTDSMVGAGCMELAGSIGGYESGQVYMCWAAMLAAAPSPTDYASYPSEEDVWEAIDAANAAPSPERQDGNGDE